MTSRLFATTLALALTVSASLAQAPQQSNSQSDVPVQSILLFSSGVGFFEHAGTVRGNTSTELRFKAHQINDILKSLILQDQDGGRISTVTYGSQDPLAKTLRSFQVDITANPSMADLLNQLRGASVSIQTQGERLTGTILGVEHRRRGSEKTEIVNTTLLNLMSAAGIRSIDLDQVSLLSLDDPRLQDELTRALAALSQARDQDRKPVTVNFAGNGQRRVRMGYVVESPVWKTSYRLLLSDSGAWLQGWAIVENQTESDWNGVSLSLVSGRPISFMMDLYRPLYLDRPTVELTMAAGVKPRLYESGIGSDRERVRMSAIPAGQQMTRGWISGFARDAATGSPLAQSIVQIVGTALGATTAADGSYVIPNVPPGTYVLQAKRVGFSPTTMTDVRSVAGSHTSTDFLMTAQPLILSGVVTTGLTDPASGMKAPFTLSSSGESVITSVQSVATAVQVADLFQYNIGNVTLARQRSAMLPIITDSVSADRVSIYNASVMERHPLNGLRLKNTTANHIQQGPVTVLDGGAYAGDARIDNVPPGQDRLLSYGVDLEMIVDNSKSRMTTAIQSGRIVKGSVVIVRKTISSQEYLVDNRRARDRVILVEHPIRPGWRLVDSEKPVETTPSFYRFQGNAVAGKVTSLMVNEERITSETIAMISADLGQMLAQSRNGELPAAVRDAITRAVQMRREIVDSDSAIAQRTENISAITAEQARIRENMKTVERTAQYYTRLLTKLNEQESDIERLQRERQELQRTRAAQAAALDQYLANLNM